MKIGRNDPCHCGSGSKYKKCCLEKDRQASAAQQPTPAVEADQPAAAAKPVEGTPRGQTSSRGALQGPRRGPPPPRPTPVRKRAV